MERSNADIVEGVDLKLWHALENNEGGAEPRELHILNLKIVNFMLMFVPTKVCKKQDEVERTY